MSSAFFRIEELTIDASHIRSFPRATSTTEEEVLQFAIKHYTPLSNPNPKPGDITIIASHANGFPKELYEPLWDELLKRCEQHNFGIRGIWIADVVHQGWSGVLNEDKLGNDRMLLFLLLLLLLLLLRLNLNSGMARSQPRPSPYGQYVPCPDAAPPRWRRP